jgi:hypothetical protein
MRVSSADMRLFFMVYQHEPRGKMALGRPVEWLAAVVASGVITLVAASVVFVDPTRTELLVATLTVWVPLAAAFGAAGTDPARLSRFTVVFCGSLVGLTLLTNSFSSGPVLDAAFYGLETGRLAVPINPVMAVLVGGATSLSYYGVFEWGPETNDGTPV